jgi:hypothetical protein
MLTRGSNIENPREMTLMTLSKSRPLVCFAMERGMSTEHGGLNVDDPVPLHVDLVELIKARRPLAWPYL